MKKKIDVEAEEFISICTQTFKFLESDYGLTQEKMSKNNLNIEVLYSNNITAISVGLDRHDMWIYVGLYHVINGIAEKGKKTFYYIDNLLYLKNPGLKIQATAIDHPFTHEEYETILSAYADALRSYGENILRGDFSDFVEMQKIFDRS